MLLFDLFGSNLSGSLTGPLDDNLIFPLLIHAFNMGIIGGALLIFAYIAVMGTLYTAQDGVFLGKKWAKTLIPLRAIIGVIAVFPLGATGFGVAQYIIYAMTYAGVGLANNVWATVAGKAESGSLSPGIPQTVLDSVNSGVAEMIYYGTINSLINSSIKGLNASQSPNHHPVSYTVGSGTGPTVSIDQVMTKSLFNTMASLSFSPAPTSTTYSSSFLNKVNDAVKAMNPQVTGFTDALTLINDNQSNPDIPATAQIGNLNFLAQSSASAASFSNSNATPYIQTDFEIHVLAQFGSLPVPPTSMPNSTLGPNDPVSIAYKGSQDILTNNVIPDAKAQETPTNSYNNNGSVAYSLLISKIVKACLDYYNLSHHSSKPENFSSSWWLAGDEYLYLDQTLAEQLSDLNGISGVFLTSISNALNANFLTVTNGGVYVNMTMFDLTQTTASAPSLSSPTILPGSTANPNFFTIDLSGMPLSIPVPLTDYLTDLQSQLSTYSGNSLLAANDLLCKLGGTGFTPNPCLTAGLEAFATNPTEMTSTPQPLDLTQGPFPVILRYLTYYFAFQDSAQNVARGKAVYSASDIYTLDMALNYANDISAASDNQDPCPAGSSCAGTQVWSNPMIVAGADSPLGNVMGYIFSGLIGRPEGNVMIAGLMAQIWCVGEVDFGACMKNSQSNFGSFGNKLTIPPGEIVTAHFSVIANAQLVGMNLIGGTVAALASVYSTFTSKMDAIVAKFNSSGVAHMSDADMAGLALLGPGFGASKSASIINAATASTVAIAALSVNLMWLPVIMIVLTTLFTTGVMFAVFIPMLPFVLFWAGKIAWLLLVVEAIFAAPLMAMAMAYPEGHDLWGMGEQGFKISLNLLLMPVLMIVGLVSAMAITYCILSFTASGFHYVSYALLEMASATSADSAGPSMSGFAPASSKVVFGSSPFGMAHTVNSLITQGIMSTFLIFMYATFISMAFNKSFSTIYVIPERVMSWIGSQGMKFGEKEGSEMQGAVSKQADQAAQAGGQAVSQGAQAQKSLGEAKVSQAQQDGQAEIQMGQGIGQSVQQDVGTVAAVAGMFKGGG